MRGFDRPTVILLGGRGFVGSAIATQLARRRTSVFIPSRRVNDTPLRVLPNVRWLDMDIHQDTQLDGLFSMVDDAVVINLVGILHDKEAKPYGPGFARAHVELPQRLIAAMQRRGLRRLLHMNALGADPDGYSMYQRSKGEGECYVRQSNVDWTIFRPSVIFCVEMIISSICLLLCNMFCHWSRWLGPTLGFSQWLFRMWHGRLSKALVCRKPFVRVLIWPGLMFTRWRNWLDFQVA